MAKLGDLKVVVGLSKSGLSKLNGDIRRMKSNFNRNFGEIGRIAKQLGTAIIGGIGVGLTAVLKSGAQLQTMRVGFRSIMGGAKEAADMVNKLNEFTAKTPFQLEEVSKSARQLLAVGTATDDINDKLKMLGDIAAASGNRLSDITAAFSKVQAKGKVELESLNQLAERGIPIFDELKKVTGDANQKFGAGEITIRQYNQALKNMVAEGGFAQGAMENLSETLDGRVSTALDNVTQALGKFAEKSGMLEAVSNVLDDFTESLQKASLNADDLQTSRDLVYDIRLEFKEAHKGNIEDIMNKAKAALDESFILQQELGTEASKRHYDGAKKLYDDVVEAFAFKDTTLSTLPDAPLGGTGDADETLEEFDKRNEKLKELREEKERLADATRQVIVTAQDEKEALDAMVETYSALDHTIKDIQFEEEEELFEEDLADRIEEGNRLIRQSTIAAANLNKVFSITGDVVSAAFANIQDKSQGFHMFLKQMFTDLLKRVVSLVAAFAVLSLFMGGSAKALQALGAKSFKGFLGAGLGFKGLLGEGLPKMASGGLFTGSSLAMVGEGPGTSMINPEVVAPLDKLQQMIGGGNVTVTGRLDGRDILISSERAGFDRNRVRGF